MKIVIKLKGKDADKVAADILMLLSNPDYIIEWEWNRKS